MYREKSKYSKLETPLPNVNLNLSSAKMGFYLKYSVNQELTGCTERKMVH